MKPMRGLPGSWINNMSKERRTALISLAFLLVLLASLVLYQRFTMLSRELPSPTPVPDVPVQTNTNVKTPVGEGDGLPVASGSGKAPAATRPELTKLSRPLAGTPKVRMSFDQSHRAFGDMRLYSAIAWVAKAGDSVLAAGPGTVEVIEENPLDGRFVVIDHGNGLKTRYAGMGPVVVHQGAEVAAGAVLGQIGEPGSAWSDLGPHLQMQVLVRGEPVDPVSYFPN